ncbi:MAG: hypothetical protein KKB51_06280 [Candidatus Riflebacteria bacterium]|nr:hypothetical protein [Candidatus Riflebacteria bacterium]
MSARTLYAAFEEPVYELKPTDDSTSMMFLQSWSFDQLHLPAVSETVWGNAKQCRAAIVKTGGRSFVSKLSKDETVLLFNLNGAVDDKLQIIPLLQVNTLLPAKGKTQLSATPARIRMIEDELKILAESVLHFQQNNNCFSCHTALPLALSCKVAAASGYRIPEETMTRIGQSIAKMQNASGAYRFPDHPDYGLISTTLCAGVIMAMLSDFSSQYLENLQKIRRLMPDWLDDDGLLKSDFYFRPLFIGHNTNLLFEAVILQTLYLYAATDTPDFFDDSLRKRLIQLRKQATFNQSEPIQRQILLMAGTPLLFQFSTAERPLIVNQLLHLLKNEPEGQRADIRALALFLLGRFNPLATPELARKRPLQNLGDRIWSCFEQIVTSLPTRAKNNQISADSAEQ